MARLKVRRRQLDFAEIELSPGKTYFCGRKEDCDVVLQPDPGISRQHFSIEFVDNAWVLKNLSPHVPFSQSGKNHEVLSFADGVHTFFIAPYEFEILLSSNQENKTLDPAAETPHTTESIEEDAPPVEPLERIHEPIESSRENTSDDPAFDQVTFHGNEEQTSDIHLSGEPYLKFVFSSHSESIRLKGNKWVAGRDSIAQIQLDDKKASRQHFSIEKVGEQFFIKDLQSANGTLLNGQELAAHDGREIKSGDIVTVNQLTMIFELRDLSFSEKLKDLPLQAYSGPLILSSQEWDLAGDSHMPQARLATEQLAHVTGSVQKVENSSEPQKQNTLRTALMAGVAFTLIAYIIFAQKPAPPPTVAADIKGFEALSPEEKKFVVDSYNSSQSYYQEGRIQNALTQLSYIHKTLPFYKDSRELESKLLEAQETLRQKEFIAQQRREQEETRLKVQNIIADCQERYRSSVDVNATKSCLNEATQLDPDHPDIQSLVAAVEMRFNQTVEAEKKKKEFAEGVARGHEMFVRAKNLLLNRDYHEAISAFSAHLNSNFPDPDHLKGISKRNVASIEQQIQTQKRTHMGRAQSLQGSGNLRDAILAAEQAKVIDPYDYSIANFIEQSKRQLEAKMKPLYEESVIEERFGNFEICKKKWKEIVALDIPTGEYYLKAKRKLQQYGL